MNRPRIGKAFGLVCIAVGLLSAVCFAEPLSEAQDILDGMRSNGKAIEDFAATLVVETFSDEGPNLNQEIRIYLMQPDAMRQEYVEPEYLAGNLNLIVGESMWTYIAATDTWYVSDLSTLSAAEQPWLLFRQILRTTQDETDDYSFDLVGLENGEYHLRGTPDSEDAAYGLVELWVDPATFVPSRRDLYDTDLNLLVSVRLLEVEEVADGSYVARRFETYDEEGVLKSVIHYEDVRVNSGLASSLFDPPALDKETSND